MKLEDVQVGQSWVGINGSLSPKDCADPLEVIKKLDGLTRRKHVYEVFGVHPTAGHYHFYIIDDHDEDDFSDSIRWAADRVVACAFLAGWKR